MHRQDQSTGVEFRPSGMRAGSVCGTFSNNCQQTLATTVWYAMHVRTAHTHVICGHQKLKPKGQVAMYIEQVLISM